MDPEHSLWLTDPDADPGGPKTYGSGIRVRNTGCMFIRYMYSSPDEHCNRKWQLAVERKKIGNIFCTHWASSSRSFIAVANWVSIDIIQRGHFCKRGLSPSRLFFYRPPHFEKSAHVVLFLIHASLAQRGSRGDATIITNPDPGGIQIWAFGILFSARGS